MAIVAAIERWAPHFSNKTMIVFTDNMAAKAAIHKGTSNIGGVMDSLRKVFSGWTTPQITSRTGGVFVTLPHQGVGRLHKKNLSAYKHITYKHSTRIFDM